MNVVDHDAVQSRDLAEIERRRQDRVIRRCCALAQTLAEQRRQGEFLIAYTGDLIHDGALLQRFPDQERIVWVLRDAGTHLLIDPAWARLTLEHFGDNTFRCQWFKLVEDTCPWAGGERATWVPCNAAEAIAYLDER